MSIQMDLVSEEQEARIRAFLDTKLQSEAARAAALAVLIPCPHCRRALSRTEAAEVYGLSIQRVSYVVRAVQIELGLPTAYSEAGLEARHAANVAARKRAGVKKRRPKS